MPSPNPTFIITRDDYVVDPVTLSMQALRVGRQIDCEILLNHPTVSRLNAGINEIDGRFYLINLSSSHPVTLNARLVEINQPEALADGFQARLSNRIGRPAQVVQGAPTITADDSEGGVVERIAEVPIYSADALVRHAGSLQKTRDALPPALRVNAATLAMLGLAAGQRVTVGQGASGEAVLLAQLDPTVADGSARVAAASPATASLSAMVGRLRITKH